LAAPPKGFQINVGGVMNSVPLKVFGQVKVGDLSGLNFLEYYRINVISGGVSQNVTQVGTSASTFRKPFDYVGKKSFPDYNAYANQYIYDINIPGCSTAGRVFVGQRAESFSINIGPIFDIINFVPLPPAEFPGGIAENITNNQLRTKNVATFALEVPKSCLGATTVGVWATTGPRFKKNRPARKGVAQKSRLGNPLVNELLIGLPDKDKWSRRRPSQDGQLNQYIVYPTFPAILDLLFRDAVNGALGTKFKSIAPTNFPRKDLAAIFLTGIPGVNYLIKDNTTLVEMIRLNTGIAPVAAASQNPYGVISGDAAGYPNGRRPGDDSIDITLRAAMGRVCHLGLGVCSPKDAVVGAYNFTDGSPQGATSFQSVFPYLNLPYTSS
jgi:hypothetical protein